MIARIPLVMVSVGVGSLGGVLGPPQGLMGFTVQDDVDRTQVDQGSPFDGEVQYVDRFRLFVTWAVIAFSRQAVFAARQALKEKPVTIGTDEESFTIFHPQEPETGEFDVVYPLLVQLITVVKITREFSQRTCHTADDIGLAGRLSRAGSQTQGEKHDDRKKSDPLQNLHLSSCLILHADKSTSLLII